MQAANGIAANIKAISQMPTMLLHYISLDGMKRAIDKIDPDGLCCACFSAKYPGAPRLHPAPAPPPHRAQARAPPPARPALATAAARNRPRTSLRHTRASRRLAGPPRPTPPAPRLRLLTPHRAPSSPPAPLSVDGRVATAVALSLAVHLTDCCCLHWKPWRF